MADFCQQCTEEIWGHYPNDMIGISTVKDTEDARYANVLCEGCGFTQVDHNGRCMHHGKPNHRYEDTPVIE